MFTNFIARRNGYELTGVDADLIFNIYIFTDGQVDENLITSKLGKRVNVNIEYDDYQKKIIYMRRKIYVKNGKKYAVFLPVNANFTYPIRSKEGEYIIEDYLHLKSIQMKLNYLTIDKALSKMIEETHKQSHYIYVIHKDNAEGRNLFGYNFSIITDKGIEAYGSKILIHEVLHSVIKYKEDGNTFGSHNLKEDESYMSAAVNKRRILTKKDIQSIVNQDANTNRKFITKLVDNRVKFIDRKLDEHTTSPFSNMYDYILLLNAKEIEVGGGILNKDLLLCSGNKLKENLIKNKNEFLNYEITDFNQILELFCL